MIRRTMMVAATLALGACGGSKAPAPDTSAGAAPASAADSAKADSIKADSMKADSIKAAADSLAKAVAPGTKSAAAKGSDTTKAPGDYDRATKPKFTIDEKTGKVTPIKRP